MRFWEKLLEIFGRTPKERTHVTKGKRLSRRFSNDDLNDIYDKNGGYCWHCKKKLSFNNYGRLGAKGAWEVDHSRPSIERRKRFVQELGSILHSVQSKQRRP